MKQFTKLYHPITSRPFLSNSAYREYKPCQLLKPYIACYWRTGGGTQNESEKEVLVIPDTCIDILIHINQTKQKVTGHLCLIQDLPFLSKEENTPDTIMTFAIRFHFWAAGLFLKMDFRDTRNQHVELNMMDRDWAEFLERFLYLNTVEEWIAWTDEFLLKKQNQLAANTNLLNAVWEILNTRGQASVKEVCEYCSVSQRQVERQFLRDIGLPPKKLANLVRYQNVWWDMMKSDGFDVQNAVLRYGYTDQAHLLKEFKRFHGVTPEEARKIAYESR